MNKGFQKWAMTIFTSSAMLLAVTIVNMGCIFGNHQPKQPTSMDKYRNNK